MSARQRQREGRNVGGYDGSRKIPQGKPIKYYLDEKKERLDPTLVDEKASKWAEEFGSDLKTTQLRRFYDEFKAIELRIRRGENIEAQEENFQRDLPLLRMFKAKALYAQKRRVAPPAFTQFIFDHVESIHDIKDLKAFSRVFEAVVAFHRYFASEE